MTDMENLKVLQLKAFAKKHNIKDLSRMTKAKVIEVLREIDAESNISTFSMNHCLNLMNINVSMEIENINVKNVKDLKYVITEKTNIIARSVVNLDAGHSTPKSYIYCKCNLTRNAK